MRLLMVVLTATFVIPAAAQPHSADECRQGGDEDELVAIRAFSPELRRFAHGASDESSGARDVQLAAQV